MRDCLGKELQVGDEAVYAVGTDKRLKVGQVMKIYGSKCTIGSHPNIYGSRALKLRRETGRWQDLVATEMEGLSFKSLVIRCEILSMDGSFDLVNAAKAASQEYLQTEEGRREYENNGCNFTWDDFNMLVPNHICEKHGFRKEEPDIQSISILRNEQLADVQAYQEYWAGKEG